LLSLYATADEIAATREKWEAIDVAEEKVAHIVSVLQTVTGQIQEARHSQQLHPDRATAALLGKQSPCLNQSSRCRSYRNSRRDWNTERRRRVKPSTTRRAGSAAQ
jgi:hypothetical protein